jgi:sulfate adenylyltransferase large subunit
MSDESLRITFVGHVDHGKSTLIGRLLFDTESVPPDRMEQIRQASEEQGREVEFAYLMDHLKEERDEGITIDTAQIFFTTPQRDYVIIDAPGHREFLKNMLTGASQAETAILLLDAAEGVGEQTRRHAFLLDLLGVEQCLVAINKMDLVDFSQERFEELRGAVAEFLCRLDLDATHYVPTSAKLGDNVVLPSENMDWYDGPTLLELLENIEVVPGEDMPPRFAVQDVYEFDGRRILAGRVESGTLDADDDLLALPDGERLEVLSVERFASDRTVAEAGECIGITVPEAFDARRGQVLCDPDEPSSVTSTLMARIFWMVDEPLERGETLDLKVITQETPCRVKAIRRRIDSSSLEVIEADAASLGNTEVAEVELEASAPVVIEPVTDHPSLGRVVLERQGGVVGAGIVPGS